MLAAAGVAVGVVLVVSGIIVAHIDDVGHCPLFETASRCPSMAPREVGGALLMVAGALVALVAARLGRHSGQSPP